MAPITLQATVLSSARLVGAQSLNVRPRAAVRAQRMTVRPATAETEAVPEAIAPAVPAAEAAAEAVAPAAEAAAPAAPAADQPPREQRERRQQPRNRMPRAQTIGPPRTMQVGDIEAGKEYDGVVVSIRDFGAFVNIGVQTDGLLHISQISTEFVRNVADALTNGQEVRVRVMNVDMERGKFAVTMIPEGAGPPPRGGGGGGGGGQWDAGDYGDRPQLKQQARAQKARPARSSGPRAAPPVTPGQAIKGKVASVAAFGVFVEIAEGFTGLLHESEMVKVDGAPPPSMGDVIDVVVVSIKADKVALSQRSAEELEQEKEMRNGGMRADTNVPAGLGRLAQQLARAGISSEQYESAVGSSE